MLCILIKAFAGDWKIISSLAIIERYMSSLVSVVKEQALQAIYMDRKT